MRVPAMLLAALALVVGLAACSETEYFNTATPIRTTTRYIAVNVEPDEVDAPWWLQQGGLTIAISRGDTVVGPVQPGGYTLIWGDVIDWNTPDPDSVEVYVTTGDTASVVGAYTTGTGSLYITVPSLPFAPAWSVLASDGSRPAGTGETLLTEMPLGPCTVTWTDYEGWLSPAPNPVTVMIRSGRETVVHGGYTERAWPIDEDQLLENFRAAYLHRDADWLADLLAADYAAPVPQSTQDLYPAIGATFDRLDEAVIAGRMFSGSPVINSNGEEVPGVAGISFDAFMRINDWADADPTGPFPGTIQADYVVSLTFDRGAAYPLARVSGLIRFAVASRDSSYQGTPTPWYEIVGQEDLTVGKAFEDVRWSLWRAMFR